eukprot:g2161.t1
MIVLQVEPADGGGGDDESAASSGQEVDAFFPLPSQTANQNYVAAGGDGGSTSASGFHYDFYFAYEQIGFLHNEMQGVRWGQTERARSLVWRRVKGVDANFAQREFLRVQMESQTTYVHVYIICASDFGQRTSVTSMQSAFHGVIALSRYDARGRFYGAGDQQMCLSIETGLFLSAAEAREAEQTLEPGEEYSFRNATELAAGFELVYQLEHLSSQPDMFGQESSSEPASNGVQARVLSSTPTGGTSDGTNSDALRLPEELLLGLFRLRAPWDFSMYDGFMTWWQQADRERFQREWPYHNPYVLLGLHGDHSLKLAQLFGRRSWTNDFLRCWEVGNVRNMRALFKGVSNMEQYLGGWDTSRVTDMSLMFASTQTSNPQIGGWNTSSVTDMSGMFQAARGAFLETRAQHISWHVSGAAATYVPAAAPYIHSQLYWQYQATNAYWKLFREYPASESVLRVDEERHGGKIEAVVETNGTALWDTSKVKSMAAMFQEAPFVRPHVHHWQVGEVTSFASMFAGMHSWDLSRVTNLDELFRDYQGPLPDMRSWDVAAVRSMSMTFALGSAAWEKSSTFERFATIADWDVKLEYDARYSAAEYASLISVALLAEFLPAPAARGAEAAATTAGSVTAATGAANQTAASSKSYLDEFSRMVAALEQSHRQQAGASDFSGDVVLAALAAKERAQEVETLKLKLFNHSQPFLYLGEQGAEFHFLPRAVWAAANASRFQGYTLYKCAPSTCLGTSGGSGAEPPPATTCDPVREHAHAAASLQNNDAAGGTTTATTGHSMPGITAFDDRKYADGFRTLFHGLGQILKYAQSITIFGQFNIDWPAVNLWFFELPEIMLFFTFGDWQYGLECFEAARRDPFVTHTFVKWASIVIVPLAVCLGCLVGDGAWWLRTKIVNAQNAAPPERKKRDAASAAAAGADKDATDTPNVKQMNFAGYLRLAGALVLLLYPMSSRNALDFFDCMEHDGDEASMTHRIFRHIHCDDRIARPQTDVGSNAFRQYPQMEDKVMQTAGAVEKLENAPRERTTTATTLLEEPEQRVPSENLKTKLEQEKGGSASPGGDPHYHADDSTTCPKERKQISKDLTRISQLEDFFGFAWAPFRSEFYWWCVVVLVKDCGFALSAVLFRDGYSQITCATSVLLVYLLSTHFFRPFADSTANAQELLLTLLLVILGFAATAVPLDDAELTTNVSHTSSTGAQPSSAVSSNTTAGVLLNNGTAADAAVAETSHHENESVRASHSVLLFWQILGVILPLFCVLSLLNQQFQIRLRLTQLFWRRNKPSESTPGDMTTKSDDRKMKIGQVEAQDDQPQTKMKSAAVDDLKFITRREQERRVHDLLADVDHLNKHPQVLQRLDPEELSQLERYLHVVKRAGRGKFAGCRRGAERLDNLMLLQEGTNKTNSSAEVDSRAAGVGTKDTEANRCDFCI